MTALLVSRRADKGKVAKNKVMRLGILADIHEDTERLRKALALLQRHQADRFVVLGDVFETGEYIEETIRMLRDVGAIGVWGNHDLGLCHEPDERFLRKYASVIDFFQTLQPRLEQDLCLFTHGLPCWDPTDPTIYYLGDRPETSAGQADSFKAANQPVLFVGHFHCWLAATIRGRLAWEGKTRLFLGPQERHLVVIHAICDGQCALFDTKTHELTPFEEEQAGHGPAPRRFSNQGNPRG